MLRILLFWTKLLKKIHMLIFRSWFGPFLISFTVLVFILMLPFFGRYKDEIFGKGLEAIVLAKVFWLAILNAIPMALPLAVLLSTLITMGGLGERYELAAMKANGISLFKIMRPLTYGTFVLMLFSFTFNFYIYPKVNLKLFTLVYDLGQLKPSFALSEGHFYNGVDGMVIHTRKINRETDVLHGIKIYDHSDKVGNNRITLADSGRMIPSAGNGQLAMTLYKGVVHEESPKKPGKPAGASYSRFYFDTLNYRVDLSGFELDESEGTVLARHQLTSDIHHLFEAVDSMENRMETIKGDLADYIAKYTHIDTSRALAPPPGPAPPKGDSTGKQARGQVADPGVNVDLPPSFDSVNRRPPKVIKVDESKSVREWFPDIPPHELLTKALQTSRAVKNYTNIIQERLEREGERWRKYRIELHNRFALPFACLVFLFIGAPLGAIVRKGGIGLPVIFSIVFFVIFYFFQINGMKFARDGILPVWVGTWLPVLILSPMAAWFTYSSSTDSPLLYMAGWSRFIRGFLYVITFGKKGALKKPVRKELSIDEIVMERQRIKDEAQKRLKEYRDQRTAKKTKAARNKDKQGGNDPPEQPA